MTTGMLEDVESLPIKQPRQEGYYTDQVVRSVTEAAEHLVP